MRFLYKYGIGSILFDLKMQVCAGGISGTAYISDNITLVDCLSYGYCNGQHMSV